MNRSSRSSTVDTNNLKSSPTKSAESDYSMNLYHPFNHETICDILTISKSNPMQIPINQEKLANSDSEMDNNSYDSAFSSIDSQNGQNLLVLENLIYCYMASLQQQQMNKKIAENQIIGNQMIGNQIVGIADQNSIGNFNMIADNYDGLELFGRKLTGIRAKEVVAKDSVNNSYNAQQASIPLHPTYIHQKSIAPNPVGLSNQQKPLNLDCSYSQKQTLSSYFTNPYLCQRFAASTNKCVKEQEKSLNTNNQYQKQQPRSLNLKQSFKSPRLNARQQKIYKDMLVEIELKHNQELLMQKYGRKIYCQFNYIIDHDGLLPKGTTNFKMRVPPNSECSFCANNDLPAEFRRSHILKDQENNILCPMLQNYECPICKATGKGAHTVRYCPYNRQSAFARAQIMCSMMKNQNNNQCTDHKQI